jgi:hypothetical protein
MFHFYFLFRWRVGESVSIVVAAYTRKKRRPKRGKTATEGLPIVGDPHAHRFVPIIRFIPMEVNSTARFRESYDSFLKSPVLVLRKSPRLRQIPRDSTLFSQTFRFF